MHDLVCPDSSATTSTVKCRSLGGQLVTGHAVYAYHSSTACTVHAVILNAVAHHSQAMMQDAENQRQCPTAAC